ncbi:uncharacterized protein METZ01_LOCUS424813, partial [marine metagenome]
HGSSLDYGACHIEGRVGCAVGHINCVTGYFLGASEGRCFQTFRKAKRL